MRRKLLAVLMLPLLLLGACSGEQEMDAPMEFRAKLLAQGGCGFTAQMQVDVSRRVCALTLQCRCDADGPAEITVLAPETIEGISATLESAGGVLHFDTVAVDFGLAAEDRLAPIALPALLTAHWASAYISAAGSEDGLLRVCYADDTDTLDLSVDTWFDADNCPVYAEIALDGTVFAELTLTDFVWYGG